MKRISFFVFVFFVCFLLLGSYLKLNYVSAQNVAPESKENSAAQLIAEQERQLAADIKQLTNRSSEGLVERKLRGGGAITDLQERFQNVMLGRIDANGEAVSACVTSLDEANAFFGKSLETGEPIFSTLYQKDITRTRAAESGTSIEEYEFYTKLIKDAAIRRLASPDSATFNIVTSSEGATEGFNDPTAATPEGMTLATTNPGTTLGAQRLNLFNYAAGIWGAYLDINVPINVNAQFNPLACTPTAATLGSAGAAYTTHDFPNAEYANTDYHLALADKLYGGAIGGTSLNQINATFNSLVNNNAGCLGSKRFYYGFDNDTPAGTVNLLVVLLHELGHGLGFSSFSSTLSVSGATNTSPITITSAGHALTNGEQVKIQNVAGNTAANGTWIVANATTDTFQLSGSTGNGAYTSGGTIITGKYAGGRTDVFSVFMYDRTTAKYWYQMTNAERQASILNNGNVLWDGPNVKIASGFLTAGRDAATGRVQMFTPGAFQPGSSISHFDTAAFANLLMEPVINDGLPTDLDLTRQLMRDIGWYRDTTADLIRDTITNVTPNSGAINTGSSKTITWTNNGGFARNVTIELSTNNGATYSTLASNIPNTGSYTFTVPNTTTTQGRVRVREYDFTAPSGVSSAPFSITLAPTAASVSVTGRVFDSSGRGISKARVSVISAGGVVSYSLTNPFGYFRFDALAAGETYVFQVTHKRYIFPAQALSLTENFDGMIFVAQP